MLVDLLCVMLRSPMTRVVKVLTAAAKNKWKQRARRRELRQRTGYDGPVNLPIGNYRFTPFLLGKACCAAACPHWQYPWATAGALCFLHTAMALELCVHSWSLNEEDLIQAHLQGCDRSLEAKIALVWLCGLCMMGAALADLHQALASVAKRVLTCIIQAQQGLRLVCRSFVACYRHLS